MPPNSRRVERFERLLIAIIAYYPRIKTCKSSDKYDDISVTAARVVLSVGERSTGAADVTGRGASARCVTALNSQQRSALITSSKQQNMQLETRHIQHIYQARYQAIDINDWLRAVTINVSGTLPIRGS